MNGSAVRNRHDAWSVGYAANSETTTTVRPLVEHWNGTTWRRVPMTGHLVLDGVAQASAKSVMVIGSKQLINGSNDAKVWNGHRWRDVGASQGHLNAVTPDPSGGYWVSGDGNAHRAIYYRFHHGRWTSHPGPDRTAPDATVRRLFVTAIDTADGSVWAVGSRLTCTPDCDEFPTYNAFVDRH